MLDKDEICKDRFQLSEIVEILMYWSKAGSREL